MHAFVSGFAMVDGIVTASYLMDLKLPNAFFAFLSACESAMGDQVRSNLAEQEVSLTSDNLGTKNLPDEMLHLAATMMFVGFKSVIGTMWYA
jgi:CHAT domain-containing protein